MRALIQRVKQCSVMIDGKLHSSIENGLLILLGIRNGDSENEAKYLAERCSSLRIFNDDTGKMNLSVIDINGEAMVISQFTLYGDTKKGNRPSYTDAAGPQMAEELYNVFIKYLQNILGEKKVATGVFRAMMDVSLINDGPVTLMVESKNRKS